ncbi:MAG: DUF2442 domain-containing protein [Limnohabitans sp.]|jgi:hypothetical protein
MQFDVTKVAAVSERCIHVELKNGKSGFFDVAPYWDKGILKELQNPQYFKQVMVSDGYVTWPHGQDIAPETLLENLQDTPAQ